MSEATPETKALAPINPAPPAEMPAGLQLFGQLGETYCSLPRTDPRYAAVYYKMAEQSDGPIIEQLGKPIRVEHVYARPVTLVREETGEEVPCIRICLMTPEGEVYSCTSEGVRKSIFVLMEIHGLPPWKDGIAVTPTLKRLAGGRQWLQLVPVMPEPEGKKRK